MRKARRMVGGPDRVTKSECAGYFTNSSGANTLYHAATLRM